MRAGLVIVMAVARRPGGDTGDGPTSESGTSRCDGADPFRIAPNCHSDCLQSGGILGCIEGCNMTCNDLLSGIGSLFVSLSVCYKISSA